MEPRFSLKTAALCALPLLAACSSDGKDGVTATAQMDTVLAAQATTVAQPTSTTQPLTDFSVWAQRLMADAISPFPIASADLSQAWTGANNKLVSTVVRTPRTAGKATISVAAPGADADATPVIEAALLKLRAQGGGILQLAPGEYRFKTLNKIDAPGIAHLALSKLSDVDIQGTGAVFVFEAKSDGILFADCQRVRIKGVTMRDARVLSGTGRMRMTASGMSLQLDAPLPAGATINGVQPMNEGARTWPFTRVRAIFTPNTTQPSQLDERSYLAPSFSPFTDGQYVSVKYTYYGNRAIYVRDSDTGTNDDVIIDGVRIGTTGGIGVLVKSRGRGLAVINSRMEADAGQPFGASYDGIHVIASGGDVLLRNNTISHTGDDQINVRSIIHKVSEVTADTATLRTEARLVRKGDEVAFFDAAGNYIGRRYVDAILTTASSDSRSFRFTAGGDVSTAVYARVMQFTPKRVAVVGNTLVDSAGRGVLMQVPNALVQNNTLRVPTTAIRLFSSYQEWAEGAGAVNVRVSGNTIQNGGAEMGRTYKFGIITAASEVLTNRVAATFQHGPMVIENNRFTAPTTTCIMVYATKDVIQSGNICGA